MIKLNCRDADVQHPAGEEPSDTPQNTIIMIIIMSGSNSSNIGGMVSYT